MWLRRRSKTCASAVFFFPISLICKRGPPILSLLYFTLCRSSHKDYGYFESHKSSLLAVYASAVRESGHSWFSNGSCRLFLEYHPNCGQVRTLVSCLVSFTFHTPTSRYAFAKIIMEECQRRIFYAHCTFSGKSCSSRQQNNYSKIYILYIVIVD
jgi:hypothetical protein